MLPWIPLAAGTGVSLLSTFMQSRNARAAQDAEAQNLQLQKDTLDYSKGIQQEIFRREDSSIQRRIEDLKAAGMSPVLAAGQGARAGGVVPVKAPQRGMQSFEMKRQNILNFAGQAADISRTVAETDLINSQVKKNTAETGRTEQVTAQEKEMFEHKVRQIVNENSLFRSTMLQKIKQAEYVTDKVKYDSFISRNRQWYTAAETDMKILDRAWKEEFATQAYMLAKKNGITINPYSLDILTKYLAYGITEYDYKYWKSISQPTSGSMSLWKMLMGGLKDLK